MTGLGPGIPACAHGGSWPAQVWPLAARAPFGQQNRGGGAESIPAGEAVADDEEGAGEGRGVEAHPKAVAARPEVAHGLLAACYPIGGGHGIGSRTTRWR
jgi:hypothetical protein